VAVYRAISTVMVTSSPLCEPVDTGRPRLCQPAGRPATITFPPA
jgi:hypothetical protein